MRIPGKRIKRQRLVQTDKYVVAVEVEMVFPHDDPSEPCYEAETIRFLQDVEKHARQGDLQWLRKHGKVYTSLETAVSE